MQLNHQLTFLRDLNYKLVKPISFIYPSKANHLFLSIWRADRLSLMRCTVFLEKFFSNVIIKKHTIFLKYSRNVKPRKKKTYLIVTIPIHDYTLLFFLLEYMSLTRVRKTTKRYLLVFSFHYFKLIIPFVARRTMTAQSILHYYLLQRQSLIINGSLY